MAATLKCLAQCALVLPLHVPVHFVLWRGRLDSFVAFTLLPLLDHHHCITERTTETHTFAPLRD